MKITRKECLLSIIIPAYNAERTIARALSSIGRRHSALFEVIVVDDGSTDATVDEFHRAAGENATLLRMEKNRGQALARNHGIKHAAGNYISFVDADDWVDENYTSDIISAIQLNDNIDLFLFGIRNHTHKKVRQIETKETVDLWSAFVLDELLCSPCCKIYRRSIIVEHKVKFDNIRPGEDIAFNARFLAHTRSHKNIPGLYYNYDCRQPSTTRRIYSFDVINAHRSANEIVKQELNSLVNDFEEKFFSRSFRFLFMHSMWRMAKDREEGMLSQQIKQQVEEFLCNEFGLLKVIRNSYLSPKEKMVYGAFRLTKPLAYWVFSYQLSRTR